MLKMNAPNDIWTTDYKGEFRPSTAGTAIPYGGRFSRFLLGIESLLSPCYEATNTTSRAYSSLQTVRLR